MTTISHAVKYLKDARVLCIRIGMKPWEALHQVTESVREPCAAIGLAKRELRSSGYDLEAAIGRLEKQA